MKIFFENANDGVMVTDAQGHIITVNPAFSMITGYSKSEAVGQKPSFLKSDRHEQDFYKHLWDRLNNDSIWQGNIWNRKKTGEIYLQKSKIIKVVETTNQKCYYIGIFNDITAVHTLQEKSELYANFDPLTNLPNRFLLQDHLIYSIIHAKNENKVCAVFFINIDRFQHINNSFGYLTGDLLLIDFAQRIREILKENEILYRIGADHFAVVLPNISQAQDIFRLAKAMLEKVCHKAFFLEDKEISSTISIGISIYPQDAQDVRDLIQNAETSMRRAKSHGGNQFQLYQPEMNLKSFENLMLESKLRKALKNNEFRVYYQPQINTQTGKLIGAEALVRWQDQDMGLVAPNIFIPLAEELGIINSIGAWVLEEACLQLKNWQSKKKGLDISIAVNISAKQFREKFLLNKIMSALEKSGLEHQYLELEITESATVDNISHVIQTLNQINQLGIKIAIDDFGTGYSSLNYLKSFPLDKLKIDKSFILDILVDPKAKAIINTIITLAHNFNLKVIAEGVEEKEQVDLVKSMNSFIFQGYYFSPPIPADVFEQKYILNYPEPHA